MRPHYSITPPAAFEPLTLAQASDHVRVDSEADLSDVRAYAAVARDYVESVTGRVSATTGFLAVADSWASICHLYRTPLVSVQSVKYYAPDAVTLTTMDTALYRVITTIEPGVIQIIDDDFPDVDDRPDAIQIAFTAGYSDPAFVPPILSHAIKMLTAHFYEQRSPIAFATSSPIPFGLSNVIENQKIGGWIG